MALEIIFAIVPTVLEYTIAPVIRHAGYAFHCAKKVTELKNQVEKLGARRESLQNSVAEAIRRGDEIQPTVENWLTDVENAIKEAGELTERGEEEAKKMCFAGLCPNFKTRYQLGKKAAKDALLIEALKKEEDNFDPSQISYCAALQQIVFSSAHGFEGLPSRASIFEEVMDALSDPKVHMIGVYGMPGTGKSTLAKEVQKQALEMNWFDYVPMATVSVQPKYEKIQGNIADVLGLKLKEETVVGRANRIRQRLLKERKVLIILDDLWENFELEKLGIPLTNEKTVIGEGFDSIAEVKQRKNYLMGYKLLLTSRNLNLLRDLGVKIQFKLDVLLKQEGRALFDKTVGDLENPRLQSMAIEVADKCAGLPLLLVTVASVLKNKQELEIWTDASNRLSTPEVDDKVLSAMKLSYDELPGEEVKAFFLLCGLFTYPNICILDLVKYSMGLRLLKHVKTVEAARNRVQKLIGDLKARCLLLDSETDGFIKMHDAVQKVAASIASRDQLALKEVGITWEEFQRIDIKSCTRIFMDDSENFEFPDTVLRCPEIVFFRLSPRD